MTATAISTTIVDHSATEPRNLKAVRSINNKMRYRLTKRRNLYVRSIAVAKDKRKIKVLEEKITVIDFALKTLADVLAEGNHSV